MALWMSPIVASSTANLGDEAFRQSVGRKKAKFQRNNDNKDIDDKDLFFIGTSSHTDDFNPICFRIHY